MKLEEASERVKVRWVVSPAFRELSGSSSEMAMVGEMFLGEGDGDGLGEGVGAGVVVS